MLRISVIFDSLALLPFPFLPYAESYFSADVRSVKFMLHACCICSVSSGVRMQHHRFEHKSNADEASTLYETGNVWHFGVDDGGGSFCSSDTANATVKFCS